MALSSETRLVWAAPSGRSSPCRASTPPRCDRRASQRSAGDGQTKAGTALGLGVRAVDLMELLEDPILLIKRYARPGVCHRYSEMAVPCAGGDTDFASVGELDGVANQVEQHLREPLLVAKPNRQRFGHLRPERELLVLRERFGGRTHGLDHALNLVCRHVQGELAGFDLGDV
jgi:hypothetical protein